MTISKKVKLYKKILSHKKYIGGAEKKPKSNEFNIKTNLLTRHIFTASILFIRW